MSLEPSHPQLTVPHHVIDGSSCPDGDPCRYWFTFDGTLVCRHGVCCERSSGTSVKFVCPLRVQRQHELKKWQEFWDSWQKKNGILSAIEYDAITQTFHETWKK